MRVVQVPAVRLISFAQLFLRKPTAHGGPGLLANSPQTAIYSHITVGFYLVGLSTRSRMASEGSTAPVAVAAKPKKARSESSFV